MTNKRREQYPHEIYNYEFQEPRRPPVGNEKPTAGQKLQIWTRQCFLNRVSIVLTLRSYISIHSIQFTRAFQPSTASWIS